MAEDNTEDRSRVHRAAARVLAMPIRSSWRPASAWPGWHMWIERGLAQELEQRRLFPWIAVAFGAGILLFFQAEGRPALWAPLLAAALSGTGAFLLRRSMWSFAMMIAFTALWAGFAASVIRTRSVEAPALARTTITRVGGFVEEIEDRTGGARLLLLVQDISGMSAAGRPTRIRVTVRDGRGLGPGDYIVATARLLPPPEPALPGGYDFARDAYFRGIGAVGSLVGKISHVNPPHAAPLRLRLTAQIDEARNGLARRIANAVGGPAGAVAAALVTGKRGLIDEPTNDVLRAAGIYHIVSISGLHMVLAAGTFFWLARALLALAPAAALLWPVKKLAAVVAMVGATAYCIFSGSEVATERSLVMTLVMFGSILVDRPALSMRNLAIAALIVLAREPETLLGPSFQMSFGAVAALIALVPRLRGLAPEGRPAGPVDRALGWAIRNSIGIVMVTLVANFATAPFSAYHFHALNPFGLVGNALALPLVSLVVMPAALVGLLAYPLGLDRPVWQIMGWAVDRVLAVSGWVSGFEGSTLAIPAFGIGALGLLGFALLVSTLPVSALRWFAVLPAGAGLALAAAPERPDILVDREGTGAAIRGRAGTFVIVGRPSSFVVEQWLRADADLRGTDDKALRDGARCDRVGCVVTLADGRSVAFVQDVSAFEEDCRRAAFVITPRDAPATCRAAVVLDRTFLRARGATAVLLREGRIEVRSARGDSELPAWAARAPSEQQQKGPRSARPMTDPSSRL